MDGSSGYPAAQVRWLPAKNNSSTAYIPAFSLVRIVSVDSDGNLVVDKPNADGQDVYIVGPFDIPKSGFGRVTRDWPAWCVYDQAGGTPAVGQTWGAASGSYKLTAGKTGFTIQGAGTGTPNYLTMVAVLVSVGSTFVVSEIFGYNGTANQSLTSGTQTTLTIDSVLGSSADISRSGNSLVVSTTAIYYMGATVLFASNATGDRRFFLRRNAGSGSQPAIGQAVRAAANGFTQLSANGVFSLNANDGIDCQVFQDSGGNLNAQFGSNNTGFWLSRAAQTG